MKQSILILYLSILLAMLSACTTITPPPQIPVPHPPATFSHDLFDRVLQGHVNQFGRVDYTALAENSTVLDRYHRLLSAYSPDSHPQLFPSQQDKLAYWINAYNAVTIKTVLKYYPIASVKDVRQPAIFFFLPDTSGFFLFQRQILGGRKISLYALENKIVRKRFTDPRYHFALNCASNSCPYLPVEAFTARRLESQLERETRAFLAQERNFRIDHGNQRIYLSAIFDWYESDFIRWSEIQQPGSKGTLTAFIRPYLAPDKQMDLDAASSFDIHFLPYDWGLNDQKSSTP